MLKLIKKILKSNKYTYHLLRKRYYQYLRYKNLNKVKKIIKNAQVKKKNKNVFFLLEQGHGNLGDIAIGYTQKKFINNSFPDYNLIGIREIEYMEHINYFKKIIKATDIICLIGGGSIGDEYLTHENNRRSIISNFKENKIISFPQSMYFNKTHELNNSKKMYSMNKNLVLIARDKISYETMKEAFDSNKVLLTPDIVLYLNETHPKRDRNGAVTFLRSDLEGVLSEMDKEKVFSILERNYKNVSVSDTLINREVPREKVAEELNEIFESFKKSELVITDRLHGMVFAAITSTPCVVLSNYNHKIKAQYEWIKHLDYIKYCKSIAEIEKFIENLKNVNDVEYDNSYAMEQYEQIREVMSN
ncbi:polysaccharide pyruvyl transferase family protein [Oceanobacillus sp. CF4.6]|uniref:polysaccharide pyruvyl transferase family protein n=1 Tax=Oceanobacillus sp. CF4.6 TaxID=3373080 RepID=UPI003EE80F22